MTMLSRGTATHGASALDSICIYYDEKSNGPIKERSYGRQTQSTLQGDYVKSTLAIDGSIVFWVKLLAPGRRACSNVQWAPNRRL